ncbi:hypothetical protein FIBSPDRAFT_900341 [Athelia psychrophila]|uniref:Uncharacterized protein n=1 Tax=Athelia psychrophila TaxID=1759441 RepID=A0A165YKV0_9AGAM|nr:hypothetical protein FIBSPDRAFT_900341 [Fibularhizoctonia sp. CBS 109695]
MAMTKRQLRESTLRDGLIAMLGLQFMTAYPSYHQEKARAERKSSCLDGKQKKTRSLDARSSGDPFDPAKSDAEVDPCAGPASVSNIATTDVHGDQAARSIRKARLNIAEWTWNLGPESGWEYWVAEETRMAERHDSMEEFFGTFREHARKGRELLHSMQCLFHLSLCGSSLEEVKDIFLQGHTLTCISKDLSRVVMVLQRIVYLYHRDTLPDGG